MKKLLAMVAGGVAVAVPAVAGLLVFLDPVRRKPRSAAGFVPVTPLDALPADGTPQRFQVIADRVDAWTKYRNVPLGAVYVKRTAADTSESQVVAFNALCPHAGCFVDVASDGRSFHCPCHNSGFNADGSLKPGAVSPRRMDELEVDPEGLEQGIVRVKFQNFVAGTHDKIPVT
jgi:menaquinol-cytochrome c reductase iron-sulfur subunit